MKYPETVVLINDQVHEQITKLASSQRSNALSKKNSKFLSKNAGAAILLPTINYDSKPVAPKNVTISDNPYSLADPGMQSQ